MVLNILIIGCGEIGSAIKEIEEDAGNIVHIVDVEQKAKPDVYDVIHICLPYFSNFIECVCDYESSYKSNIKIIHSTVKLGTTDELNGYVHSPCQGKHPNLKQGILTFPKFVGGDYRHAKPAISHLEDIGIPTAYAGPSRITEAMKLLDTTYYGWLIAFATKVAEYCKENELDFDSVYTTWNNAYNEGQSKIGSFTRPVLTPSSGGLGGHCVYENAVLLAYPKLSDEIIRLGKKK